MDTKWHNQRGSSLIVVIMTLAIVSILGLSMTAVSMTSYQSTVKSQENQQAYFTAKSLLDGAVNGLQNDQGELVVEKLKNGQPSTEQSITTGKTTVTTEIFQLKQPYPQINSQTVVLPEGMGSGQVTIGLQQLTITETTTLAEKAEDPATTISAMEAVLVVTAKGQYQDSVAQVSAKVGGEQTITTFPEIGEENDSILEGLFKLVLNMHGTSQSICNMEIEGDIFINGSIKEIKNCIFKGNVYINGSTELISDCTFANNIYINGSISDFRDSVVEGKVIKWGQVINNNTTIKGGMEDDANTHLKFPAVKRPSYSKILEDLKQQGIAPKEITGIKWATGEKNTVSYYKYKGEDNKNNKNQWVIDDFNPAGPVVIFVENTMAIDFHTNREVGDEYPVVFICDDGVTQVDISPNVDFDGYIYGQNIQYTLWNDADVDGALVGAGIGNNGGNGKIDIEFKPLSPSFGQGGSSGGGGSGGGTEEGGIIKVPFDWQVTEYYR